MSEILIIAGMHRSGTSLTANWLKENGLFIGHHLLSGEFDNINGHFEDIEILKVHEENLIRAGYVSNGLSIPFNTDFFLDIIAIKKISEIINSRKNFHFWGWKEPRGTLFLNDWEKINPNIFCLGVYRNYNNVVDSLVRRYQHTLFYTKKIRFFRRLIKIILFPFMKHFLYNNFLKVWIIYNQKILEFNRSFPKKCILLNINELKSKDEKLLHFLNKEISFFHKKVPFSSVFEEKQLNEKPLNIRFKKRLSVKAEEILTELKINTF